MRIKLVDVGQPSSERSWTNWTDGDRFAMASQGLVSIASLSRDHDDVAIHDEKVSGPADPDTEDAEIVGLSFKTQYASRAYELAAKYRARGKKVVLGGVHVTNVPEEAVEHGDVVCVGEGEPVWREILDDLEAGTERKVYRAPMNPRGPMNIYPRQRHELLDYRKYMVHAVQSARGCTFDCEFCPTRLMFGSTFRQRTVDSLIAEAEHLLALEDKPIFFTENVFGAGDIEFVRELAGRLNAIGARWSVICDWVMINRPLMKVLADNGCQLVCINLTGRREEAELEAVRAIHDHGMDMWGYIMFGFEEDTPDVFQGAVDTVEQFGIACASLTVLAPYPGTPMGRRLKREGRITSYDMQLYDQCNVVIEPKNMTSEELIQGYRWVCDQLAHKADFVHAVRKML